VEPRPLNLARALDATPDDSARLAGLLTDEITVGDRGDLQVNVDPIQERTGDPRAVALDGQRPAAAGVQRIAEIAAGTPPRCLSAMSP
jgi:hypothetical protein